MTNEELIATLRYCFEKRKMVAGVPLHVWCDRAAYALEAADKRIDGLQKLVDINTERCEALRKQLREAHESYEKHLNELEAQSPKEGEWIVTTEVSDDGAVTSYINCSRCGFYWREPKHGKVFKRCPNCGARMKGEHDED